VIGEAEVCELQRALRSDATMVFAQGLEAMSAVARLPGRLPAVVWDLNDLESVKFFRSLALVHWSKGKPLRYLQTLGLYAQERRAARAAALGFVCSEVDRRWASRWLGGRFLAAPNAVSVPVEPPPVQDGAPTLLFVGFAGYEPNRDAADWMIESVWPLVHRRLPDARLLIAGDQPQRLRSWPAAPAGVELLGFVPDLAPVYSRAQVVVCPVRSGSGTRVKLLEAAAQARALVSTRIGAEGIDFEDGKSIVFAERAEDFADACVALLREPARARQMGRSAWELVRRLYSRDAVIDEVRSALKRVMGSQVDSEEQQIHG
jgi:glycosyltransferase involved in cell wall biosynthesis